MEDVKIVPAEMLPGWHWHKYSDGSGHLQAPDGTRFMLYDLDTNEYKLTTHSVYELFTLSYYYADGIKPNEFDPFDFMEKKLLRILEDNKS